MSKPIPPISKYMTSMPHSIELHQTLKSAKSTMRELNIRHLPVLSGGQVVGLLSERDIDFLASFKDIDLAKSTVEDAMTQDPYCVEPDLGVDVVAAEMAERKIGSVLIVQGNGKLVGIFTYVDALRCLAELFESRLKK